MLHCYLTRAPASSPTGTGHYVSRGCGREMKEIQRHQMATALQHSKRMPAFSARPHTPGEAEAITIVSQGSDVHHHPHGTSQHYAVQQRVPRNRYKLLCTTGMHEHRPTAITPLSGGAAAAIWLQQQLRLQQRRGSPGSCSGGQQAQNPLHNTSGAGLLWQWHAIKSVVHSNPQGR